jgi:hypothetical protein
VPQDDQQSSSRRTFRRDRAVLNVDSEDGGRVATRRTEQSCFFPSFRCAGVRRMLNLTTAYHSSQKTSTLPQGSIKKVTAEENGR